jgi:ABC-type transport system involved in multi-copper enzyme maturation permease subunit
MSALLARPRRLGPLRDVVNGVVAVGVKELRGRMRGRRAFVVLTLHLVLVAGFAWMIEAFAERTISCGFGAACTPSADIGRQLFVGLVFLLTLIVLVLAPASTAGAISLEREKQTLDLLATTPISSLAIVLGKLLSALSWVFLLMLASIPVAALVFTFGGVGPEDLVRAYVVLLVTAIAFGSIGLFVSALVKRTQAATVINLVAVITLTVGTTIVFIFWTTITGSQGFLPDGTGGSRDQGLLDSLTHRPPEALLYLNPFVSQVDVVCGTDADYSASCSIVSAVTNRTQVLVNDGTIGKDGTLGQPFGLPRDTFWPKALAAMGVLSVLLVILSVQLVSPSRRWHLRLPRRRSTGGDA